jgi:hypothetical protein
MGALEQAIERAILAYVDRMRYAQIFTGTAKEVSETTCTVVRDDAPDLTGVRLNAIDDELSSFFTVYPQEGSTVLVGILEGLSTEAVVLRCSEVEKVDIKIGEHSLLMNSDGFTFNGGNNKGLIVIDKLKIEIDKLNAAINALKIGTSASLTLVNAVVPGASAPFESATASIQAANLSGVTNEKIKH